MVNSFPVSVVAAGVLGFLTGLGTGGGSLLILWLTFVCRMEPGLARTINLMFFLPAALFATVIRSRNGKIPWKKLFLPVAAGCGAALVAAAVSPYLNTLLLQKLFGVLLLCIGIREIRYKERR